MQLQIFCGVPVKRQKAQLCLQIGKRLGRHLWRAVQPNEQVAGTGDIIAQMKNGVPTDESVQPESEGNDSASQSGRNSSCSLLCHMCIRDSDAGLVPSNWTGRQWTTYMPRPGQAHIVNNLENITWIKNDVGVDRTSDRLFHVGGIKYECNYS
jgi:hypothetical protein